MKFRILTVGIFLLFVLIGGYLIYSNEAELKIKHIEFNHLPENHLRFKVKVETNKNSNTRVLYWKENSSDTLYSPLSEDSKSHLLWIINTKEQQQYQFQIKAFKEEQEDYSKIYSFKTKPIFQSTPYFKLDFIDSTYRETLQDKYFLTQKLTQPGSAIIIDHQGQIAWYEAFEKGVKVSNWTSDNTILCILGADNIPFSGGDEIVEIDLSGKIKTRLKYGEDEMDKMVHHDVRFDTNNNIYALTFDNKVMDLSSIGGTKQDTIHGDGIVVLDKKGKKIWEWSIFDHLDPLQDPNILKDRKDWVHANSLEKDEDGNFLISFRDLNQVWNVNPKTGEVNWKLGENGDFEIVGDTYFSGQHAVHVNQNGNLMMLDNGLKKQVSRVASYDLDTSQMKAYPQINLSLPEKYFSVPKGNAYLLNEQEILVCMSHPRLLMIVDATGQLLWKLIVGGDPYRVQEAEGFLETQFE